MTRSSPSILHYLPSWIVCDTLRTIWIFGHCCIIERSKARYVIAITNMSIPCKHKESITWTKNINFHPVFRLLGSHEVYLNIWSLNFWTFEFFVFFLFAAAAVNCGMEEYNNKKHDCTDDECANSYFDCYTRFLQKRGKVSVSENFCRWTLSLGIQ